MKKDLSSLENEWTELQAKLTKLDDTYKQINTLNQEAIRELLTQLMETLDQINTLASTLNSSEEKPRTQPLREQAQKTIDVLPGRILHAELVINQTTTINYCHKPNHANSNKLLHLSTYESYLFRTIQKVNIYKSLSETQTITLFSLITKQLTELRNYQHLFTVRPGSVLRETNIFFNNNKPKDLTWEEANTLYQFIFMSLNTNLAYTPQAFFNIAACYLKLANSKELNELDRLKLAADILLQWLYRLPFEKGFLSPETKTKLITNCRQLILSNDVPNSVFEHFSFKKDLPFINQTEAERLELANNWLQAHFFALPSQKSSSKMPFMAERALNRWQKVLEEEQEKWWRRADVIAISIREQAKVYYSELKHDDLDPNFILQNIYSLLEKLPAFADKLTRVQVIKLLDLLMDVTKFTSLLSKNKRNYQEKIKDNLLIKEENFYKTHPTFFFVDIVDWMNLPATVTVLNSIRNEIRLSIQWHVKFTQLKQKLLKTTSLNVSLSEEKLQETKSELQTCLAQLTGIKSRLEKITSLNSIKAHQKTLKKLEKLLNSYDHRSQKYHPDIQDLFEEFSQLMITNRVLLEEKKSSLIAAAPPYQALQYTQETWNFLQAQHFLLDSKTRYKLYISVLGQHMRLQPDHAQPLLDDPNIHRLFNAVKAAKDIEALVTYCDMKKGEYQRYLQKLLPHQRFLAQWTLALALFSNFASQDEPPPAFLKYLLKHLSLHCTALVQLLSLWKGEQNVPAKFMLDLYTILGILVARHEINPKPEHVKAYKGMLENAKTHVKNHPHLYAPLSEQEKFLQEVQNPLDKKPDSKLSVFHEKIIFWSQTKKTETRHNIATQLART